MALLVAEVLCIYPVEIGVVCDVGAVIKAFLDEVRGKNIRFGLSKTVEQIKQESQKVRNAEIDLEIFPLQPQAISRTLRELFPDETIVVMDGGNFAKHVRRHFDFLEPGDLSCMCSGWCMAMTAKLAYPEKPVVSVTGDGAFMMTLNELETAVDNKLPVLVVVPHNSVYGNVRRKQFEHFDERFAGSELYIPNLAQVAESFGAYGERVEKPSEIIPALERAFASGKPAVLDVIIDASRKHLEPPAKLRVKDRY